MKNSLRNPDSADSTRREFLLDFLSKAVLTGVGIATVGGKGFDALMRTFPKVRELLHERDLDVLLQDLPPQIRKEIKTNLLNIEQQLARFIDLHTQNLKLFKSLIERLSKLNQNEQERLLIDFLNFTQNDLPKLRASIEALQVQLIKLQAELPLNDSLTQPVPQKVFDRIQHDLQITRNLIIQNLRLQEQFINYIVWSLKLIAEKKRIYKI